MYSVTQRDYNVHPQNVVVLPQIDAIMRKILLMMVVATLKHHQLTDPPLVYDDPRVSVEDSHVSATTSSVSVRIDPRNPGPSQRPAAVTWELHRNQLGRTGAANETLHFLKRHVVKEYSETAHIFRFRNGIGRLSDPIQFGYDFTAKIGGTQPSPSSSKPHRVGISMSLNLHSLRGHIDRLVMKSQSIGHESVDECLLLSMPLLHVAVSDTHLPRSFGPDRLTGFGPLYFATNIRVELVPLRSVVQHGEPPESPTQESPVFRFVYADSTRGSGHLVTNDIRAWVDPSQSDSLIRRVVQFNEQNATLIESELWRKTEANYLAQRDAVDVPPPGPSVSAGAPKPNLREVVAGLQRLTSFAVSRPTAALKQAFILVGVALHRFHARRSEPQAPSRPDLGQNRRHV